MAPGAAPRRVLTYREARARVLAAVTPRPPEVLPLAACLGRALRETVQAPHDLPPFPNSAMDGWAVRADDLAGATAMRPVRLRAGAVIPAGAGDPPPLHSGAAARIMTGAMIPDGADAVVPVEETLPDGSDGEVAFARPAPRGQHVRAAGEDLRSGAVALEAGRELSPHDLGLLAALGKARVAVGPRPRAIVLSTGDELLDVDAAPERGRIRDSNALALALLLEAAGAEVRRRERLRDDPGTVRDAIDRALAEADVVLTIGGVSMGDFDPVRDAIAGRDGIELWRVAMRPGQPQAFGASGGALFFGLPGNPASVACVFEALVRPALRRLQGHAALDRPKVRVRSIERIESRAGRTDFVRVRLATGQDGLEARPAGVQLSGHLTPQSRAHALLIVPEEAPEIGLGESAEALVLRWPEEA